MKIKHKYLRNKAFRNKHWNSIRSIEHPYRTYFPYFYGRMMSSYEEQVKWHFEEIQEKAKSLESGCHSGRYNSTSSFRRVLNQEHKARERAALNKVRQGNYDASFPIFKKNANWYYF